MHDELLIALLTGLGGMLGWGFADFFAKKTIDRIGSVVSLAWAHVFGTLAFVVIVLHQVLIAGKQLSLPTDIGAWGLLLLFGSLQAAVYLLAYQGFGKGKIAVLNPAFASYSGLAALLSIAAFGEAANSNRLIALVIIFSGIFLLSIDISGLKDKRINLANTPGLKEVLLASLLAAMWTVFWDRFLTGNDWLLYALIMYAFMTFAVFTFAKLQKIKLTVKSPGVWKFLVLIGLCETVAYLAISYGFSATTFTSVVALLSGAFSLPTIILAHIFLKERVTTVQRIGTLVVVAGIIFLSLR